MKFDLKKLTHALTVARLGSFSMAAAELGLTQPTLSRSISSLEAAWGVRLFERDRTGVMPTGIGAEMLQEAARLLTRARTLDLNMQQRADARAGAVAFGMSGLTATIFMGDLLAHASKVAPDLQVSGKIETLSVLTEDIRHNRIEFGIFSETQLPRDDDMTLEVIGEIPVSFIVRAGHPLAGRDTISWENLAQFPLASSTPTRIPVLPKLPTIICDDYGVARNVMLGSDAVWLSSSLAVKAEIAAGQAHELHVLGDLSSGPSQLVLMSLKNKLRSPAAKLIVEKLKLSLSGVVIPDHSITKQR